jgi:hypothetical protein
LFGGNGGRRGVRASVRAVQTSPPNHGAHLAEHFGGAAPATPRAPIAGITPETGSRILSAEDQWPSFETIVRIALASNEHVGYLIGERVLSAHDEGTFLVALYALREQLGRVITLLEERVHEDQLPPREDRATLDAERRTLFPMPDAPSPCEEARLVIADVIVRRRVPTYDLLIVTPTPPDIVCSILAKSMGLPPDTSGDAQRLQGITARPWSFIPRTTVRVAPSVGGANVHVQMTVPPWTILILIMFGLVWLPTVRAQPWLVIGLVAGMAIIIAWIISGYQEQREALLNTLARNGSPAALS